MTGRYRQFYQQYQHTLRRPAIRPALQTGRSPLDFSPLSPFVVVRHISSVLAQSSMRPYFSGISRFARVVVLPVLTAVALSVSAGCSNGNGGATLITVFAAASLTDAFADIAGEFEESNPGVEVKLNFAGSQRLRSQLELGARADVFVSADERQMALAEASGLILGESVPFASASMAIIVSTDSGIHELHEIAVPGVKLVLAHADVPAGQYARQLLSGLSQTNAGLGADFTDRALANVVSEETSVKFVEQKVVLGQADAGIVYRPGAIAAVASGSARELPLPEAADGVRAVYPIAILLDSNSQDAAEEFVRFVLSPQARRILAAYGFDAP